MFNRNIVFLLLAFFVPNTFAGADTGDTAWILTSTALVLFMTLPGLALFYGGLVRTKNVLSVLMQCFAIACLISVCWVVYGYSLAFKGDGIFIGDLSSLFLNNIGRDSLSGTLPETVFITFQMTFAIITPALVVGAFAERMKFGAMCLFSIAWFTLVYLPACHMVWGGGYLASKGVIDFAGGLVVHATCGIGALVIAIYLGKRDGFLEKPMPPHNRTMVMIGASMLWVGWFGFNAGSAVAADGNAGMAMLVTHISAALGALTWMAIEWFKSGKATIVGIATGMVAGLATITPASGTVGPAGAMLIGVLAGSICFYATQLVKSYFRVDDSLDVFPVHGVGGILGIIMLSLVGTPGGFLGNGSTGFDNTPFDQLLIQLEGIFVICAWTGIATYVILKTLNIFIDIRVTKEEEEEGLDVSLHNEQGYNL
ncbi:MAG: ammonium transporter [Gammaproteobacteria bacterium]